ncbi:uncharacterized protein LOC112348726 [Selaginella moellendorffii]|uniref:uncharacterized protein LOC112348726 n=1 Tax=Selaginella moellendorffii TaxID=88036 RepID=UPI000D1C8B1A|nr:uncharacterized protein LOC112348726 [Selaginella moellendorffii]|eukprot:XP_024537553.1 uncharacterized protein LOC112348726 [Selaginella moellendorffii]
MCALENPGAALCDHVQRHGLQGHLFSDITVCFQSKDYKLHRIILSQSLYFKSLLSGPWKESGKPRVELKIDDHNVTVEGLEIAFAYLYGVAPAFSNENAVGVLAAGCFLCIENLCEQCVQFMVSDIRVETFLAYQQLSERHCYGHHAEGIRDACWSYLCFHAARELSHVLSKLSLPLLCRLLKSDELWVTNESERYKLAKQALVDWKLSRRTSNVEGGSSKRQRVAKSNSARKAAKTASGKSKDKGSKPSSKDKTKKKGEASSEQKAASSQQKEDLSSTPLKMLRRLWDEDAAEEAAEVSSKDGFEMVMDLFCGGGITFAYMDANEGLQARKELEDANMPTDVVNDAIWQNVLLKTRVLGGTPCEEEEEDSDSSESGVSGSSSESSESDWSSPDEDEAGNASSGGEDSGLDRAAASSAATLVPFSTVDECSFDGKRRKSTGGFSWSAKLHSGMQMSDFPPFRFGTEFTFTDKAWYCSNIEKDVFFGGSRWKVTMSCTGDETWWVALHCRPCTYPFQPHMYVDQRKVVRFAAKLFMRTSSGLQCVTGTGQRKCKSHVGVTLSAKDIPKDKLFRVVAAVQLMEDESKAKTQAKDEEA